MYRTYEHRLTGRARARHSFFGGLILQVQVEVKSYSSMAPPPPGRANDAEWKAICYRDTEWTWRDATWDDLQSVPLFTLGAHS